jgi:multidrug efflux pump subunit AcrA (membrane-fusion protein)
MYATVTIDVPATELGLKLAARGPVLAVPETAVVHTGSVKVVWRQDAPTVFDAVPVELGRPSPVPIHQVLPGDWGLTAGEKVVTVARTCSTPRPR